MFHYVYRTTHIPTSRWYVGIRTSGCWPGDDPYLGSGKVLRALVRAHPRGEFSKQVLAIVETREEAARIEAALARPEDPDCLNLIPGGDRGILGYRYTDEQRARLRDNQNASGLVVSEAHKQSIRESNRSRVVSDETRERMSAAQRARSPKRGSNGRFE
jgi:hypothetical protein